MVNDEAWFPDGSKISFHFLKENAEEEIFLRDIMATKDWDEDVERLGNDIIVLQ